VTDNNITDYYIWDINTGDSMITIEEADLLYQVPKYITEDLKWERSGHTLKIKADVFTESADRLIFYATKGRTFSFSLVYRGASVIRRFDMKPHKNPDGKILYGPHKHFSHDKMAQSEAYLVEDINPMNVNEAIMQFFKECNISLEGAYDTIIPETGGVN
jgi:hypothetical protein